MPIINEVVNLRHSYAIVAGDRDTQLAYEAEVERARASQPFKHAVAPRQELTLHDGRRLPAGSEVRITMFRADGDVPGWRQLENLVTRGVVIESHSIPDEADEHPPAPQRSRPSPSR